MPNTNLCGRGSIESLIKSNYQRARHPDRFEIIDMVWCMVYPFRQAVFVPKGEPSSKNIQTLTK